MFDFLGEMPPVTKIVLLLQLIGLLMLSMELADRYDFYFNFEKIIYEGQVRYFSIYIVTIYSGLAFDDKSFLF